MDLNYEATEQAFLSGDQTNGSDADKALLVRFLTHPKLSAKKTEDAGRPIFDELEYVEIMIPGSKDNIIKRPATKADIARFPRQHAAFKSAEDQDAASGTLLSEWPGINRSQVEEMKFFNIRTVEQLSSMSDGNLQNFMGGMGLRTRALAYLELSGTTQAANELAQELEMRDSKITELQQTNQGLIERITALEKKQNAPTPPRKTAKA